MRIIRNRRRSGLSFRRRMQAPYRWGVKHTYMERIGWRGLTRAR